MNIPNNFNFQEISPKLKGKPNDYMNKEANSPSKVYIDNIIQQLEQSSNAVEASKLLRTDVNNGNLNLIDDVLYKHADYYITHMLNIYGAAVRHNLESLNKLKTGVVPEYVDTVQKGNDMYIVTRIKGAEDGDLIPFFDVKDSVTKDNKLEAFHDLQKITRSGIVDQNILRSPEFWFVTPKDKKIIFPSWSRVRPIDKNEGKEILARYYNFLFN